MDCVGCLCHDLCIKSCCDVCKAGIGREIPSESIIWVLIGTVTEGFTVPETVITKYFCENMCLVE